MQIFTESQGALVCLWLSLLFVVTGFCYGDHRTVEVVGLGECADWLRVTVDCKSGNGDFETRGDGELDENGNFKIKISLSEDIVKDNELKEECYAQLHSASAAPCPAPDGLDKSKIVIIKSESGGNHTLLGPAAGKLKFSSLLCTSAAFFWPFFKHPLLHPKYFAFPPKASPPKHPLHPHVPPPAPMHKKPLPPPVPIVKKPSPPKVKKALPPPTHPSHKPLPPFFNKPLPPPFPKLPPFPEKPCPPLPNIPPNSFFQHPKSGEWPPLPPFFSPHS